MSATAAERNAGRRPAPGWRRLAAYGLAAALAATALAGGSLAVFVSRIGPPDFSPLQDVSTLVVDRNGALLRPFTTHTGRWRLPVELAEVDTRFLDMLIAYEDRRFRDHHGVDPRAVARAAWQLAVNGRIVSGASTITMQLARLLEPHAERSFAGKLVEAVRAVEIERRLSKDEILAAYLTLAPYGGNLEGVRAASIAYFGKEPRRLSLAEAALLVALPQSPERRRPDRAASVARAARDRVLDRMVGAGVVTPAAAFAARERNVPTARQPVPMIAAHLAEDVVAAVPDLKVHRLTIDRPLQESLEQLAADRARLLGRRLSAAILVVDNETGAVRAHVGSAGYLDMARAGQVDMTRAVRSPGSTLKPFIYGLAFEEGIVHPETLIEDRPTRFGAYRPENFEETFQGTVTVRQALQLSLNVPAVSLLEAIGPDRLFARFREVGVDMKLPPSVGPNLAVGLGGVGLRLADLARLYAALARGGSVMPLVVEAAGERPNVPIARPLLGKVADWYVADILAGAPPPNNAAGGLLAYKTGTSYGYRDAWSVGFDSHHTVAVWVGRPDGAPVPGLVGRVAAAPVLFDAFSRLGGATGLLARRPAGALVAGTAELPPPLRHYRGAGILASAPDGADAPLAIAFPPDGAAVDLGATGAPSAPSPLALKAAGGRLPLTFMVNGRPVASSPHRREASWAPDGPGFAHLSVIDADGVVAGATVRIE
ncbi:MAG: penicillin-binding protein 1C [Hyphomicrobiales bacterium]